VGQAILDITPVTKKGPRMKTRPCRGCGWPMPALPGKIYGIRCGCAYWYTLRQAARRKRAQHDPEAERRRKGGPTRLLRINGEWVRISRRRRRSSRKEVRHVDA
jgi:hypothetical protein